MSEASRDWVEQATARIGERLVALRAARGLRVGELAREAGVSSSLISQIERGQSRPSVATLFALARVLEVPVDAFFGDEAAGSSNGGARAQPMYLEPQVVRRDERAALQVEGGVQWERLTRDALPGLEFLELVYPPAASSDEHLYRHPGVELVTVTQGVMTIYLGFDRYDLSAGDSIAFASSIPHRYANEGTEDTRAITVLLQS